VSERVKTIAAVVFFGLFLLAAAGCLRSFLPPTLRFESEKGKFHVICIFIEEKNFTSTAADYMGGEADILRRMREYPHIQRGLLGFGYMSGTYAGAPYRIFIVPYWFNLLATGTFPLTWWIRRRRTRRRAGAGQCPGCGYDLRATPGRCPECGWRASLAA
jgi:hypothetical protein